jgi:hypothetical protein
MSEQTWWQGDDARRYQGTGAPATGGGWDAAVHTAVASGGAPPAWAADEDRTVASPTVASPTMAPDGGAYAYGHAPGGPGTGGYPASGYRSGEYATRRHGTAREPAADPAAGAEADHALGPPERPKGLRNWPTSARVTVGVLALTTLLGFVAAANPEQDEVQAGSVTTEAPVTTAGPTSSSTTTTVPTTVAPTTTAPPTTLPPTTAPTTTAPPPTTAAPAPEAAMAPAPAPSVYYANCDAARAAGAAPVRVGDPGYASHLDRDGDGVGCE